MSTSPCGAPSPGPSCAGCSPRPTTRSGGPTSRSSTATVTSCPSGSTRWAGTSTRLPARCCRPGMRPWMPSARYDLPWHVARFGERFDAQGVLAGSPQAATVHRLPDQVPHQAGRRLPPGHDRRAARSRRPAGRGAAVSAVLAAVRELAAVRHPAQERPARPGPRRLQGQGPRRRSPRLRRAAGPGLPQVVRQDPGRPPRRPQGLAAADPRCFGNRPGPVRLGTRRADRPGSPGPRPTDAARRR